MTYRYNGDLCNFRWDVNAMDGLPDYMKTSFFALHNSVNEMAFDTLKEQGVNIVPYLKKVVWTSFLNSSI